MVSRVAQSWEENDGLKGMVSELGAMLSSQGVRERGVRAKLRTILPEIVCSLSVRLNPSTTTDDILREMKRMLSLNSRRHLEPQEELFFRIIATMVNQISAENPDVSQATYLLKNLILLIAAELDMLPIRDSKLEMMIEAKRETFHQDVVDEMIKCSTELSAPNAPYAVVSIVGAQSSGKSYLLNQLFGTNFPVMDPSKGWSRTTDGIMVSRCINPSMLILDVEGFDGVERQKMKDPSFENKAALFTLAVSDVMMVNINETDINRNDGGGTRLFTSIFQERAALPQGSTQIIVVVRRYGGEIPFHILEGQVNTRMKEIWENVHQNTTNAEFRDFIEVKVVALPDKLSDDFQEKVTEFRKLLSNTNSELGAKVPASSFSHSSMLLWEQIRGNKRLDLPSHKVTIAMAYCKKIVGEALNSLYSQKEYEALAGEESPHIFKQKSDTLVDNIITKYDIETMMYDNGVRDEYRQSLLQNINKILAVYSKKLIIKAREKTIKQFQDAFAINLDNMEENIEPSYYDSFRETYRAQFTSLCEELKEFDTEFFHEKCIDLQSELHIYIRSNLLSIAEERARKEIHLAHERSDENVQVLMKKLEETTKERQRMDEEMKREKEKHEQESRRATEDLERAYQNILDKKEQEISRLQRELEAKNAWSAFSLSSVVDMLSKVWDFFA